MNINQAIQEATNLLNKNNIKSSKLDSEILMAKAIKKKREYIILNSNKPLQNDSYNHFKNSSIMISVSGLGINTPSDTLNLYFQNSLFPTKYAIGLP